MKVEAFQRNRGLLLDFLRSPHLSISEQNSLYLLHYFCKICMHTSSKLNSIYVRVKLSNRPNFFHPLIYVQLQFVYKSYEAQPISVTYVQASNFVAVAQRRASGCFFFVVHVISAAYEERLADAWITKSLWL